jgi:hypothetical protein
MTQPHKDSGTPLPTTLGIRAGSKVCFADDVQGLQFVYRLKDRPR